MIEEWRPVVGFEGLYEVSNLGRVRSFYRTKKLLKLNPVRDYRRVITALQVSLSVDGKPHYKKVHQLVLEAFVGIRPKGKEGCHGDNDPTNNRIENLRWGTHKENGEDQRKNGLVRGSKNSQATMTEERVREIKSFLKTHHYMDVARIFGVPKSTMHHIKSGRNWSHV